MKAHTHTHTHVEPDLHDQAVLAKPRVSGWLDQMLAQWCPAYSHSQSVTTLCIKPRYTHCVCVCVCVSVREQETERVCVCVHVYETVCVTG